MKYSVLTAMGAVLLFVGGCAGVNLFGAGESSAVSPDGRNAIRLYSDPLAYEVVRDGSGSQDGRMCKGR